jgi:hypothetical protein
LTVLVISCISAFVFGTFTSGNGFLGFGGKTQKTKQTSVTKSESKPVFVRAVDGNTYVLQASKSETKTLNTNEEAKMTLWQKLMLLPKLWLILMVLGIFFPPIAAIMGFINKKLWGEARRIVGGVEESLKNLEATDPAAKQKMLDTLSKKYDSSTKALVSKIKCQI